MTTETLIASLTQKLGQEHVITDENELTYYGQDVFSEANKPLAVIRPGNKKELAETVGMVTEHDIAILPRGGGMSYTSGYLSNRQSVMVDMCRMTDIIEINLEDMYVTVEAGCRWVDLYEALKDKNVKTPMWGTLSGLKASIGGGASQNSVFFGSGQNGAMSDSIIGMEVVTSDGKIVTTGSGAIENGTPFFRHFGPDLTGLFTGDTGALGVKATLTLKLVPDRPEKRFVSFNFDDHSGMLKAIADVARENLASECFGFDPFLQQQRMKRESLAKDIKTLGKVIGSEKGFTSKLKSAAEVVIAGRDYMKETSFSFHAVVSEMTDVQADKHLNRIREIANLHGGIEVANSIPKIIHAHPFVPLNNMIGPEGERWVPVHCLVPHSKAIDLFEAIEDYFASKQEVMEKYKIEAGHLILNIGNSATLLEPVFFWPDELMEFHHRNVEEDVLERISGFEADEAAREVVVELRDGLLDVFADYGATHFQVGRTYRYSKNIKPETLDLITGIKNVIDPKGLMNPGSLGLG